MKRLYSYLPQNLKMMIASLPEETKKSACELRLRVGGVLSLSTYTKNLFITTGDKNIPCRSIMDRQGINFF